MLSIRHWDFRRRNRRQNDTRRVWTPTRWALWSTPPIVLGYVLAVDLLALLLIGATARFVDIDSADWIRLAALALGSALHVEASRGIERLRWSASEGVPYANLKGMWTFAAVLCLPPPLAVVLILSVYLHSWLRLRRVPPYRWVFSTATVLLGAAAAAVCMNGISPTTYPDLPGGPLGLVTVAAAATAYWFVNYALVVGAVLLSNPEANGRKALGPLSDQLLVFGALGLGVATSSLLTYQPWLTVALLVTVLGMHRALLVGQFQFAARTDPHTGLANTVFWHEIATKELERAQHDHTSLGVLYLDLDHFKTVNDTYGHPAGDQVLKAIAVELKHEIRTDDLIGRLGGEEFAVLLPKTSDAEIAQAAERIRRRIAGLSISVTTQAGPATVEGLTCSIGAATYPSAGCSLDALLLAADTATYAAKNAGRNRVVTAPANGDL
ncbi:GGDEF domain-containing protein [Kribbella monticola]|uniref:GGDEF domain-containing protein n=1 Tax=Kribbella monticola TaxID=2185285 RepID=UPI00130078A6|nr:GGDEF domain-containing protein [Kribbella monticola]